uniref:Uncharacterized protein n=1 Tax=Alexandrium catenella TaxID=2925 RepID=A0A7S1QYU1_ALECA
MVFRQRDRVFSPLELSRNAHDPSSDLFSRLDRLERYRGSDGKMAFKIVFPRVDEPNWIVWEQSTNPIRMRSGESVDGFEAIDLAYHRRDSREDTAFNGLQRSRSEQFLMHAYDPANPETDWYVIGSQRASFAGAKGDAEETCVELYALRPS